MQNKSFLFGTFILSSFIANLLMSQPMVSLPEESSSQMSVDSIRRDITKRILSPEDKKEIRSCDREKSQFLKDCRLAEPGTAELDQKINQAKLNSADPNAPDIQALLERKFKLEKKCDAKYSETQRGHQCLAGEQKRQKSLEKALQKDPDYQKALTKMQKKASPK